jgi:hypothetical protein
MSMSKYETEGGAWTLPESGVVKLTLTDVVVHGTTSAPPDFIIELEPEGSSVPQSRGMLLLVVGAFLVNCSFGLYSFLRNIAFVKVHIE